MDMILSHPKAEGFEEKSKAEEAAERKEVERDIYEKQLNLCLFTPTIPPPPQTPSTLPPSPSHPTSPTYVLPTSFVHHQFISPVSALNTTEMIHNMSLIVQRKSVHMVRNGTNIPPPPLPSPHTHLSPAVKKQPDNHWHQNYTVHINHLDKSH